MINERRAFGERLRRQREKQHITLDQIAASTKVAASLFAGLKKATAHAGLAGCTTGPSSAATPPPSGSIRTTSRLSSRNTTPHPPSSAGSQVRPCRHGRAIGRAVCAAPEARSGPRGTAPARCTPRRARGRWTCSSSQRSRVSSRLPAGSALLVRTRDLQHRVPGRRPPAVRTLSGRAAARARTSPDSAAVGRGTTGRGAGRGNGKHGRLTTVAVAREVSRQWAGFGVASEANERSPEAAEPKA